MTSPVQWIWQQAAWPHFEWRAAELAPLLRDCTQLQGRLQGMLRGADATTHAAGELDALLQNIVTSSAIEGERLNVGSVRSSLARRLGLEMDARPNAHSEGLAELQLDATHDPTGTLDLDRLLHWHTLLFPDGASQLGGQQRIGQLRGEEPMQVVSGRVDKPRVHFEAPPRAGLEQQVDRFLAWFNASRAEPTLDPLLRAGIAHFWFVTVHPFEDGNGRLTRAITDLALTQSDPQGARFYAMSESILDDRRGYYAVLEASQKATLDVSAWLQWFLKTLRDSLERALARIDRVLAKSRYWHRHRGVALSTDQLKLLNRLLDGGPDNFPDGISAAKYGAAARVSKATATRHLADLLEKGLIERLPGAGRSTRYRIRWPDGIAPLAAANGESLHESDMTRDKR